MKSNLKITKTVSALSTILLAMFLATCGGGGVDGDGRESQKYTLTVNVSPAETGVINKSPDNSEYDDGSTVTLTALPNQVINCSSNF